jgi:hypothetical protein
MIAPLAQGPTNPLVVAIIVAAVSLPIGVLVGCLWGYNYKRRYLRVARELANLKGENFRGELTRIGVPQGRAARPVALPTGAEKLARAQEIEQELRQVLAERTAERDQLSMELEAVRVQLEQWRQRQETSMDGEPDRPVPAVTNGDAHRDDPAGRTARSATPASTGTEAWQLAQLHREQIAMQLRLDDCLQQIEQLTQQRDQWQQQASTTTGEFQQLRQLLVEQEALIASVERQRDSLATRLGELEQS